MSSPRGSMIGELGPVGLFDLGQLLALNRATGCLVVESEGRKGRLYFTEGKVTHAIDDEQREGPQAAQHVLTWRTGRFEFVPDVETGSNTIAMSTESIILEAARLLDSGPHSGGDSTTGEVMRLRERQNAMAALRDVFDRVSRESGRRSSGRSASAPSPPIEGLTMPGDRLVLRPNQPTRLLHGSEWRNADDTPLKLEAYGELKARLLAGANPEPSPDPMSGTVTYSLRLPDGRTVSLSLLRDGADEALWIRPIGLPAPDSARLVGPWELMKEILSISAGVMLVGGQTTEMAGQLLHAIVAALAERRNETLMLASDDATYRHEESTGLVVRIPSNALRHSLKMVQPATLVLDTGVGLADLTLDELETVRLVVAGSVAPEAGVLLTRWLTRVGGGDSRRAHAHLATTHFAIVMARPGTSDGGPIPFAAWIVSEEEREASLRGEPLILDSELGRGSPNEPRLKVLKG